MKVDIIKILHRSSSNNFEQLIDDPLQKLLFEALCICVYIYIFFFLFEHLHKLFQRNFTNTSCFSEFFSPTAGCVKMFQIVSPACKGTPRAYTSIWIGGATHVVNTLGTAKSHLKMHHGERAKKIGSFFSKNKTNAKKFVLLF